MRLIDEDEIKKREHDVVLANGAKHRCFDTTMLFEIPTVDAVEVVRCKDCKKFRLSTMYENWGICLLANDEGCGVCREVHGNSFCSWGDRKNEVEE